MIRTKIFSFLLLVAGILFAGCSDDVYVTGTQMYMYDYDVRSYQWQQWGDAYRAVLDVPDITHHVVADGNVQVSRCFPGDNNGIDVWTPLPMMRVEVTEGADGGDYYYTTFIDYEWTLGTVTVYVTASDLYTGELPADMSFRVTIMQ